MQAKKSISFIFCSLIAIGKTRNLMRFVSARSALVGRKKQQNKTRKTENRSRPGGQNRRN